MDLRDFPWLNEIYPLLIAIELVEILGTSVLATFYLWSHLVGFLILSLVEFTCHLLLLHWLSCNLGTS
jgi:hypothetical protein